MSVNNRRGANNGARSRAIVGRGSRTPMAQVAASGRASFERRTAVKRAAPTRVPRVTSYDRDRFAPSQLVSSDEVGPNPDWV
jgi:hypothetical protein